MMFAKLMYSPCATLSSRAMRIVGCCGCCSSIVAPKHVRCCHIPRGDRIAAPMRFIRTPHERGIFCNRTLNLRSIKAIGYDMDYTLIHYHSAVWERAAYEHCKQNFLDKGWPIAALEFDPLLVSRGLIIDTELGNLIKANRFGFVKRAMHGTRPLEFEEQRNVYARTIVDLSEDRWLFLNTL